MAGNEQDASQYEHRGCLAMMVEIGTKDWGNQHGQQWEYCKDRLCRLAHIAHITIGDECNNRKAEQTILQVWLLLEV